MLDAGYVVTSKQVFVWKFSGRVKTVYQWISIGDVLLRQYTHIFVTVNLEDAVIFKDRSKVDQMFDVLYDNLITR